MMPMIRAAQSGVALLMQGVEGAAQPGGSLVGMLVPMTGPFAAPRRKLTWNGALQA